MQREMVSRSKGYKERQTQKKEVRAAARKKAQCSWVQGQGCEPREREKVENGRCRDSWWDSRCALEGTFPDVPGWMDASA